MICVGCCLYLIYYFYFCFNIHFLDFSFILFFNRTFISVIKGNIITVVNVNYFGNGKDEYGSTLRCKRKRKQMSWQKWVHLIVRGYHPRLYKMLLVKSTKVYRPCSGHHFTSLNRPQEDLRLFKLDNKCILLIFKLFERHVFMKCELNENNLFPQFGLVKQ